MEKIKFTLFLSLLLCLANIDAFAHDFEVGGIYYDYLSKTDKTVSVSYRGSSYNSYSNEYTGNVVIPASVTYSGTTYSVKSIGSSAFRGCTGLTSIEIPNSVTSIGSYAFAYCSGLTSIQIPSSVTSIVDYAFSGCTGLTSITIPSSVTSISSGAFEGCKGLTSIQIPSSVTSIGYRAFYRCPSLKCIYNYAEFPQDCGTDAFSIDKTQCTLYVLPTRVSRYRVHKDWRDFNIQPMTEEMLAIESIACEDATPAKTCFDLQGRKVTKPQRGQLYLQDGKKAIVW